MTCQIFGIDGLGRQNYSCDVPDEDAALKAATEILCQMGHVDLVICVANVPNVSQIDSWIHITYRTQFRFILKRERQDDDIDP